MNRYSSLKTKTPLRAKKAWNPTRKPWLSKKKNTMKRGGSVMSKDLRIDVGADPEYKRCALQGLLPDLIVPCDGRVTREHALIYAGKKIQEKWAIPPICACHHGVDLFQDGPGEVPKDMRVWVALNRATDEELIRYSKVIDYRRERERLNEKYGPYIPPTILKK